MRLDFELNFSKFMSEFKAVRESLQFQHLLVQEMIDESCEKQKTPQDQRYKLLSDDHASCSSILEEADNLIRQMAILETAYEKHERRKANQVLKAEASETKNERGSFEKGGDG